MPPASDNANTGADNVITLMPANLQQLVRDAYNAGIRDGKADNVAPNVAIPASTSEGPTGAVHVWRIMEI